MCVPHKNYCRTHARGTRTHKNLTRPASRKNSTRKTDELVRRWRMYVITCTMSSSACIYRNTHTLLKSWITILEINCFSEGRTCTSSTCQPWRLLDFSSCSVILSAMFEWFKCIWRRTVADCGRFHDPSVRLWCRAFTPMSGRSSTMLDSGTIMPML